MVLFSMPSSSSWMLRPSCLTSVPTTTVRQDKSKIRFLASRKTLQYFEWYRCTDHLCVAQILLACSSDRKRLQDREEVWQRLEQQAMQNYANLSAQGAVSAPMPHHTEPISVPLGKWQFLVFHFFLLNLCLIFQCTD